MIPSPLLSKKSLGFIFLLFTTSLSTSTSTETSYEDLKNGAGDWRRTEEDASSSSLLNHMSSAFHKLGHGGESQTTPILPPRQFIKNVTLRKAISKSLTPSKTKQFYDYQDYADQFLDNLMNVTGDIANETMQEIVTLSMKEKELNIPKKLISQTFRKAEEKFLRRVHKIESVWLHDEGADAKSPIGMAFAFNAPNSESLFISNTSIFLEYASRAFLKSLKKFASEEDLNRPKRQSIKFVDSDTLRFDRSAPKSTAFLPNNAFNDLSSVDVSPFMQLRRLSGTCGLTEETSVCDKSARFRTYSGYCNNPKHPTWGKSVTTFDRMLPAVYNDGVSSPRVKSVLGGQLPSPRYISSTVHIDVSHLSNRHTLMFMQYAQFLDHDITLTPVHKGPSDKILNCRSCDSQKMTHPECWPVPVPSSDRYYPAGNMSRGQSWCIPFTRSLPGQQTLGHREQINQNSAYIDSSQIYGENVCKAMTLRSPGGKLNITQHPVHGGKPLLPQITFLRECRSTSGYCFYAGDARASEQPALAVVHTVFLRQHNDWADKMRTLNPQWDEERIYQETRRLMGAVNQHIAYNELLPRILGPSIVNAYGLVLQPEGFYSGYDPNCSPAALNEFATAAFRFGHSLIRPQLSRMDNRYNRRGAQLQLREGFFNSDMMYEPLMVDELIRGLLAEPMEQMDPFVTNEITNHLFEDKKRAFSGMDLVSLNIQRARDHGIPGYNQYRAICGLKKAVVFSDLAGEISSDVITRLQMAYSHVDDIDLFTGSLVERGVPGGLLGPTMCCIIGTQFQRLRRCDRYWYETNDPQLRFTPQQLAEIRKITISKLVCDNLDTVGDIQKHAFDAPHNFLNPRIPCDRLPTLNLEAWRENPVSPYHAPAIKNPQTCSIGGRMVSQGGAGLPSPCVSCICTAEGTKCASLRITSCSRLFLEAAREDISRDQVCMAQCGFMMTSGTSSAAALISQPPHHSTPAQHHPAIPSADHSVPRLNYNYNSVPGSYNARSKSHHHPS